MHRNRILLVGGVVALPALAILIFALADRPASHSVTLSWNAPAPIEGVAIVGYNVYRSTNSRGPYVPIAVHVNGTGYKDTLVSSARIYYYVVTSVDSAGQKSRYSDEIKAV